MIVGSHCNICDQLATSEPYLIEIGDNVTISAGVSLITHDNSISKVISGKTDLFGKIIIGNNCFIGNRSIIMYGVQLADIIIVASGSVVTKSFLERGIIIGGNPARVIGHVDTFGEKNREEALNLDIIPKKDLKRTINNPEVLIVR